MCLRNYYLLNTAYILGRNKSRAWIASVLKSWFNSAWDGIATQSQRAEAADKSAIEVYLAVLMRNTAGVQVDRQRGVLQNWNM